MSNNFRNYLLILLCMLGPHFQMIKAQETEMIQGIVLERGKSDRIANANIRNKNTKQVVSTDLRGEFRMQVRIGDTLEVSKIGYLTIQTEIKTFSEILLDLPPSSVQLDEVTIKARDQKAEMEDVMDSYRRKGIYQQGKPSVLGYIFNPLTSLYERFSRTGQQARRFRNYMENEQESIFVDRIFNAYRISQLTSLNGVDLENFMFFYRPSFEKSRYWGDYDVNKYISDSFVQFEKDGRPSMPRLPKIEMKVKEK